MTPTPMLSEQHWDALAKTISFAQSMAYEKEHEEAFRLVTELPAILRALEERGDLLERVYDAFGIGKNVRTATALMTNLENTRRFSGYLAAVEREFFMVPGEPSDEPEDEGCDPEPDCILNRWGAASAAAYVQQFRKELPAAAARLAATPPQAPAVPVAWIRKTDITELTDSEPESNGWTPLYAAPAPQPAAVPDGQKLWLWQNGDHYLAFAHEYPCYEPAGDPMTLGEPVATALLRKSFDRALARSEPHLYKSSPDHGEVE